MEQAENDLGTISQMQSDPPYAEIAAQMRTAMKAVGWPPAVLAQHLGIPVRKVGRWYAGKEKCRPEVLKWLQDHAAKGTKEVDENDLPEGFHMKALIGFCGVLTRERTHDRSAKGRYMRYILVESAGDTEQHVWDKILEYEGSTPSYVLDNTSPLHRPADVSRVSRRLYQEGWDVVPVEITSTLHTPEIEKNQFSDPRWKMTAYVIRTPEFEFDFLTFRRTPEESIVAICESKGKPWVELEKQKWKLYETVFLVDRAIMED